MGIVLLQVSAVDKEGNMVALRQTHMVEPTFLQMSGVDAWEG